MYLPSYDKRAGNVLYNIWGKDATKPTITTDATQFGEGAVVVKAAFSSANADVWPVMQGAQQWTVYISTNATKHPQPSPTPQLDQVSFFQFDIIVKDTQSAPATGWVFTTLVYDKDASGDFWDKMVPLGAMWGNDPQINSETSPNEPLTQTWINPRAPAYSKMTLGWGGRLSGPNDGAVNDAVIDGPVPLVAPNLPSSSCMSCHSVAEWPMKSFLLPTATDPQAFPPQGFTNSDYLVMWPPGSTQGPSPDNTAAWTHWFQSRPGTVPADTGTVAFDYDMVATFKSLIAWAAATASAGGAPASIEAARRTTVPLIGGSYNGRNFRPN